MEKKQFEAIGVLKGVEVSSGEGSKGPWQRASLKIEGKEKHSLATFDVDDIQTAIKMQNKTVKAVYTLSPDGKYKNLVGNGMSIFLTTATEGDDLKTYGKEVEETIGVPTSTKTPESMARVTAFQSAEALKQRLIVRQNSWSQANNYLGNILKAVELGIIDKANVDEKDFEIEALFKIANKIEDYIFAEPVSE